VIDDGSGAETRDVLRTLARRHPWVRVETRPENGGKGAALKTGYRLAAKLGFSHALQLDADGQHDVADLPRLLEAAKREPDTLVLGMPSFEGIPRSRHYGRWISCFWVWVETCSMEIRDPLCGVRCMPLDATLRVIDQVECGDRMDFDPEIAVRLVWAGIRARSVPCRVRYPADGVSHFDLWRDNLRITSLHTRLFLGMFPRAPGLLLRHFEGRR
jgi:glycosyltransferase involved in cell wall biosynthesis